MWKIYEDFNRDGSCLIDEMGLIEVAGDCLINLRENGESCLILPRSVKEAIEIIERDGFIVEEVGHIYELEN